MPSVDIENDIPCKTLTIDFKAYQLKPIYCIF